MTSYTETREAYAAHRTLGHLSTDELEAMEGDYLSQITWSRWQGTDAEIECARVQEELMIRLRARTKAIAA